MKNNLIVVFDGNCGFCNKTLIFIAKNDINDNFTFVSSLSEFGIKLLSERNLIGVELESIILFEDTTKYSIKSLAIKKIMLNLPYYNLIGFTMGIIPRFISDFVYIQISIRRKQLIKSGNCEIPNANIREKFILK